MHDQLVNRQLDVIGGGEGIFDGGEVALEEGDQVGVLGVAGGDLQKLARSPTKQVAVAEVAVLRITTRPSRPATTLISASLAALRSSRSRV